MAEKQKRTFKENLTKCVHSPSLYLFCNFLLSSWGNRMWYFAVGIYLFILADNSLRFSAIYGFSNGVAVLLFGSLIGDWIDRNGRLKVARITLFVQNISEMLSAAVVLITLQFELQETRYIRPLCDTGVITFAIIAQLGNIGYKIAIEKDWICVICHGNTNSLAKLNSVMRAIDMSCAILAPTIGGLIMAMGSLSIAAGVIIVWNIVSLVIEYLVLLQLYKTVPELALSKTDKNLSDITIEHKFEGLADVATSVQSKNLHELNRNDNSTENVDQYASSYCKKRISNLSTEVPELQSPLTTSNSFPKTEPHTAEKPDNDQVQSQPVCRKYVLLMFEPVILLVKGWKLYAKQRVVFAGLALAMLYMTVLGFDSLTVGYVYANQVSEAIVGIAMALSGFTGLIATFIFSCCRKRFGLNKTGLTALIYQLLCLTLCVVSIWAPGSLFDPYMTGKYTSNCTAVNSTTVNNSTHHTVFNSNNDFSDILQNRSSIIIRDKRNVYREDFDMKSMIKVQNNVYDFSISNSVSIKQDFNDYIVNKLRTEDLYKHHQHIRGKRSSIDNKYNATQAMPMACPESGGFNISIFLFLLGIILSRTGLWMADLSISQLYQEHVVEKERGSVNGVQNSLNMLLDMIKFILVIFVPDIETFGYLIIVSYIAIAFAGFLFGIHSLKTRKSLAKS